MRPLVYSGIAAILAAFMLILAPCISQAQIVTNPAAPVVSKAVTITFDSSKESRLGKFSGELYAHTGVIIHGSSDWQHVIGDWGNNANQPKLTNKGDGIYELVISPDIGSFYGITPPERVIRLAFVFRSANWENDKKQTSDMFVDVLEEGLVITVNEPENRAMIVIGSPFSISATASEEASLRLFADDQELAVNEGTTISFTHSFPVSGWKWIIAEAMHPGKTVRDSITVFAKEPVTIVPKPAEFLPGINYTGDHSVALVLWAPHKQNSFVLGDFNEWQVENGYQMNKDGDWFWIEIDGLEKGKPYVFQYLIDGAIQIADPYTTLTSDPNDLYIPSATYPGLVPYPSGKARGVAGVLQTGQLPYNWEATSFSPPPMDNLVIYELLIRDFTAKHSYRSVTEKLDSLKELGVNVLELMPVNEFEGNLGWGYNPSFYFAADKYYGAANDLKQLVDEAHKRGIAVVIDMVLNHSYSQSPLVQLYFDPVSQSPAADNPWYNSEHNFLNPDARWGYDFNHDSPYTRQLVDSINSYWMKEFKIDGFRFDFTKGFSNTIYGPNDWGSAYDSDRIANLKRMADEIWKRNPEAIVILEHLADNSEEKELAAHGLLLWGNLHYQYSQAVIGNNSDLSWGHYASRGWAHPRLVTYMESHDEERIVWEAKNSGRSEGGYNIKQLPVALERVKLASLFLLPLPGPKMIWQFGEVGYDYSINTCEIPSQVRPDCRLSPKPILWNYFTQPNRNDLFKTMARLNFLKNRYEEFSPASDYSGNLKDEIKWYKLSNGGNHVVAAGNFGISSGTVSLEFPVTGTWNDYFGNSTYEVTSPLQSITLNAGEYRLFTSRKMDDPYSPVSSPAGIEEKSQLFVYPNPSNGNLRVISERPLGLVRVYSLAGAEVCSFDYAGLNQTEIPLGFLTPGVYFLDPGNGLLPGRVIIRK